LARVTPFPKLKSPRKNPVRSGGHPALGRGGARTTQRGRTLKRGEAMPVEREEIGTRELLYDGFERINKLPLRRGRAGKWYEATAPAGQRVAMFRLGPREWYALGDDWIGVGSEPYRAIQGTVPVNKRQIVKRHLEKAPQTIQDRYEYAIMEILTDPRVNPKRKRATKKAKKKTAKRARKNPVKRDKKSGKKLPDVTKNFKRFRVRGPQRFVKTSFKTISLAWAKSSMKVDTAYALKKARAYKGFPRTLSKNAMVVVGKFNANAKGDRPKGVKGDYLAWGIQTILVPKPKTAKRATKKKVTKKSTAKRRSNPGPRLMVMNPLPKHIERFRSKLTPTERKEFDTALRRYIKFHGGAYPAKISKVGKAPGKGKRFLVGMGRAVDVGYDADKRFPGSNKTGTPWRHEFKTKNALMATTANGKQILVLNKPGDRKGFKVTDWVRG
jgi:predicted RecA/RadA family phage recombinase